MSADISANAPRSFLSSGESHSRLQSSPEVASLHFNPAAPDASLLALAIARATGAIGISEIVLEIELPLNVTQALEAARDASEEVKLILEELQRRDGLHRAEVGGRVQ